MIGAWLWRYVVPILLRVINTVNGVERALAARCVQEWLYGYNRDVCAPYINALVTRCPAAAELRARVVKALNWARDTYEAVHHFGLAEALYAVERCART